jgi:uncharacterized membrane protein YraQ (UPF0718 family)
VENLEQNVKFFIVIFTSIVWEAMPFIVLGAVIAGILEELVPQQLITRLIPRNRPLAIAMSCLLGLVFPMCECGIIPVMRRLLRKGLPLSCCTAYILAGPIINVVVFLSTYVAFEKHRGGPGEGKYGLVIVGLRMLFGFLVAFGTSLIVERLYRKHGTKLLVGLAVPKVLTEEGEEGSGAARRPWMQRLGNISETALHDFVDIMVFLMLGALLAATTRQLFTHEQIAQWSQANPILAILLMMGMAIVLCLCSEADAFVAASFTNLSPAAKVAFLVLGPMLDFKLYLMYTRVFRPRLIWTIITAVVVQVFLYSYLTHLAWEHGYLDQISAVLEQWVPAPAAASPGGGS